MDQGRNPYITVMLLGSGYAAIELRYYDDDEMWDIHNTGMGRYGTYEEAAVEGRNWALCEGIPFKEGNNE